MLEGIANISHKCKIYKSGEEIKREDGGRGDSISITGRG